MKRIARSAPFLALSLLLLAGCSSRQPSAPMAPPVNNGYATSSAPPMGAAPQVASNPGMGVFNWRDVPVNEQVPVSRAVFDQGGYQIFTNEGTIVVPFENQNLYVMRFGRSNGPAYFMNENGVPTLYLSPGGFLENAAAANARWYPIPNDYAYTRPMYVGLAPTWGEYTSMGWYPGMNYYGGLWGYSPGVRFSWMPGFSIHVGGSIYRDYGGYSTYYRRTPGYLTNRVVYNNYSVRPGSTGSFGGGRVRGGTGSFGNGRTSAGMMGGTGRSMGGGTGSFGSGRSTGGGTGSFGTGRSSGMSSSSGGFSRPSSSGSFGGSTGSVPSSVSGRSGSSFGGSAGSFRSTTPRSGSSFGGTRSFGGGSFGGSGSSSGTRSFGGSSSSSSGRSSSSGGSFGRRR